MNNELIDLLGHLIPTLDEGPTRNLLEMCKAALTEKREDEDHRELEYHLLASEMVYEGNSVQHWRQKALAYKECAGVIYELKSLLGVETPADVLEQVKTQQQIACRGEPCDDQGCPAHYAAQQEAEPVAWTLRWPSDIKRGTVNYKAIYGTKERAREYADGCIVRENIVVAPLFLHPPKPAAQPVESPIGKWLSAMIDDPKVCEEMKADIRAWFNAGEPYPPAAQPQVPEGMELLPEGTAHKAHAYLSQAADDVEGWGAYASEYFQKKHDLQFDIELWKQRSEEFRLLAESAAKEEGK